MATNPVRKVDAFKEIKAQLQSARGQLAGMKGTELIKYPDLSGQIENIFDPVDVALVERIANAQTRIDNAKAAVTDADRIAYAKENESAF
jgi:hypothetical protein